MNTLVIFGPGFLLSSIISGVAYVRGACLSAPYFRKLAYNFGIGEASTSFNGIIIAAHEVGHL